MPLFKAVYPTIWCCESMNSQFRSNFCCFLFQNTSVTRPSFKPLRKKIFQSSNGNNFIWFFFFLACFLIFSEIYSIKSTHFKIICKVEYEILVKLTKSALLSLSSLTFGMISAFSSKISLFLFNTILHRLC